MSIYPRYLSPPHAPPPASNMLVQPLQLLQTALMPANPLIDVLHGCAAEEGKRLTSSAHMPTCPSAATPNAGTGDEEVYASHCRVHMMFIALLH